MIAASTVVDIASMEVTHSAVWEPFRTFLLMKKVRCSCPVNAVCRMRLLMKKMRCSLLPCECCVCRIRRYLLLRAEGRVASREL